MSVNPEIPDESINLKTYVYFESVTNPMSVASEVIIDSGNPTSVFNQVLDGGELP